QMAAVMDAQRRSRRKTSRFSADSGSLCKATTVLDDKGHFVDCSDADCVLVISPETAEMFTATRVKIQLATQLADNIGKANADLRKAHAALYQSLNSKESAADTIAEILQFVQSVKTAVKDAKSLNK